MNSSHQTNLIAAPFPTRESFLMSSGRIRTFTGKMVDLVNPTEPMIDIRDIAHALSRICRFGGHIDSFYSVAQHSIVCSNRVPQELALCGLLHDATEAYIGDMVRPLKYLPQMAFFRDTEQKIWEVIARRWGLPDHIPDAVKKVDDDLCWEEGQRRNREYARSLVNQDVIERMFLERFSELYLGDSAVPAFAENDGQGYADGFDTAT